MASKLHTACGDTTLKNGAGKETMEFLKDILGEDLYKQVSDTVNAYNGKPENKDKQVKLPRNMRAGWISCRHYWNRENLIRLRKWIRKWKNT